MTLLTYTLAKQIFPAVNSSMYQVSYTKAAQNDTLDVADYTPIKTIYFVIAVDNTAGAIDETTWSGTEITLTGAETGTGSMLIVGTC
jgi:hypothetical protein